mmetsp:Transcript_14538/g.35034  ORF Transcript_14538/g.35034 Transcript_14538/m.35034 type:complete len:204 (+) Transcript_14538:506-1117(+)
MVATVPSSYPMSRTSDRMYVPPPHRTARANRGSSRSPWSGSMDGTVFSSNGFFLSFLLLFLLLLRRLLFLSLPPSSPVPPSLFSPSLASVLLAVSAKAAAADAAAAAAASSISRAFSRYVGPSTTPERITPSSNTAPTSSPCISTSLSGISTSSASFPVGSFLAISYSLFPSIRMALYNGGTCLILPVNFGTIFSPTASMLST